MHLALLAVQDNKLEHSQDFLHTIWPLNLHPGLRHCCFQASPTKLNVFLGSWSENTQNPGSLQEEHFSTWFLVSADEDWW